MWTAEVRSSCLPQRPWRKRRRDHAGTADSPQVRCLPGVVLRFGPLFEMVQSDKYLVIINDDESPGFHQVYLNAPHPADPNPGWYGHNTAPAGRRTLSWLIASGSTNESGSIKADLSSLPKLPLVERYRRPDLGHLESEVTVEDPGVLSKPYTIKRVAELAQGYDIYEFICAENERDAPHMVGKNRIGREQAAHLSLLKDTQHDDTLYQRTNDRSRTGGDDAGDESCQRQGLFEGLHGEARAHDSRDRCSLRGEGRVGQHALPSERELILIRAADVLESMRAEVVDLLIEEGGATFGKSQFEVSYVVGVLRSAAGECRRIMGNTIPCDVPGRISMAIRRPLGVVCGIAPFNFPLILATKKVAFALAAGNTFVLKPSEETSLVGLKIAEIFDKAGLPPGVLNVVTGDGPTLGEAMYSDPRVKAVLFTGSTAVGRHIGVECARRGKKFDLEMGGKSPLLVMKDANLKICAVDTACFGLFIHQGQICMAGSRIIVEEPVYDKFLEMFVEEDQIAQGRRSARSSHGDRTADPRLAVPLYRLAH